MTCTKYPIEFRIPIILVRGKRNHRVLFYPCGDMPLASKVFVKYNKPDK